jgi:hypothetical protein
MCCWLRGGVSPVRKERLHFGMDSVRFGRALGFGARAAAKTLVTAVDAATSPNPSAKTKSSTETVSTASGAGADSTARAASASTAGGGVGKARAAGVPLGQHTARTTTQVRQTAKGLKQGGKRFGEAVWGPFVKVSGELWLELTGVFFGIFAVFAGGGAWRSRAALHETSANHDAHVGLLISATMAVVFGYFCVSSFVKANRRSRGR